MKLQIRCYRFLLLFFTIQTTIAAPKLAKSHHNKRVSKFIRHENVYELDEDMSVDSSMEENFAKLEVDILKCPNGCVCQYAHFMDLPVSRWISHLQQRRPTDGKHKPASSFEIESDNEAVHDGDENFLTNPFIKQATCILQEDSDETALINSLPHDLQALILLYTGIGRNKTVNTGALKALNQLTTLEIRGTQDRKLRLLFDEPLSFIQHANFESITLQGSDLFKRPKNPVHPKDSFDYKPKIEMEILNIESNRTEVLKLGFKEPLEENEILPYNVYKKELKKARMPSFYGWDHLEVLRIHSCQLDELYWEMFDGLESLQHLSLERNEIVFVPDFALYGALHIKTLSLAHNRIHDLHYRALAGLLELEMLDLSDNDLGKLSELSFPPFPKLERIDFRLNPLRYIFPATFWVMNMTRTMLFSSKQVALELWPNEPFNSLRLLEELSIENISIGVLEQNIFKGLSSLRKLTLHGNIRRIEFDAFASLGELIELDMSNCSIRELSMDTLIGVRKLQILDMSYNNISYIPPGLLEDQNELIEIYLQGNQLRTLPTGFFKLSKLKLARLNDNPWKCSCDMANWRAKITNQVRDLRSERCITDFQTGKQISCRRIDAYKFDNRQAPRCENFNGRSVFYVLRKQLKCINKNIIRHRSNKQIQRDHKKARQPDKQSFNNSRRNRPQNDNRMLWQIEREQKMKRTLANSNSLEFTLQQEHLDGHEMFNEHQEDISNNIF